LNVNRTVEEPDRLGSRAPQPRRATWPVVVWP
jgi:hypothetical protein